MISSSIPLSSPPPMRGGLFYSHLCPCRGGVFPLDKADAAFYNNNERATAYQRFSPDKIGLVSKEKPSPAGVAVSLYLDLNCYGIFAEMKCNRHRQRHGHSPPLQRCSQTAVRFASAPYSTLYNNYPAMPRAQRDLFSTSRIRFRIISQTGQIVHAGT